MAAEIPKPNSLWRANTRTRRAEIHLEPAQKHHHREPGDDEEREGVAGVEGRGSKIAPYFSGFLRQKALANGSQFAILCWHKCDAK